MARRGRPKSVIQPIAGTSALDQLMAKNPALYKALIEQVAAEKSLYAFTELMWDFVEPSNPFVGNWHLECLAEHLEYVSSGDVKRLLVNVPPGTMKSLMTDVFWPAWEWIKMPHMRYICTSYSQDLTERDNNRFKQIVTCDLYKAMWGSSFDLTSFSVGNVQNNKTGFKLATSTGGVGTGARANRVIVDDPHNIKEAESETIRKSTLQYFSEVLPTRLTDPKSSAIIVIMQRVHEEDVSGYILEKDLGYMHLMLPMEFDEQRRCSTYFPGADEPVFTDPRTEQGELLFPQRFPDWVVERDKKIMGPYACTPAESPILMSDLSFKQISKVMVGDEVVGFTTETNNATNRRTLIRAVVKKTFSYMAPVVKIKLKSGHIIRCTEDHKWYMGKQAKVRQNGRPNDPIYKSAKVGKKLMRVCDDRQYQITPEQERIAGWVSGFFDGEGSASEQKRRNGGRPACAIAFYQTCEKNLPICNRLEKYLDELGFNYVVDERKRPEKWQRSRAYRLIGNGLPLYQKFLHVIKPEKWKKRIEDAAYKANFIIDYDEVLSIEPDGVEPVYALETTTGNYVVWGLASSNSAGQFQQSPTPRGGGIIKREWWQVWPPEGEDSEGVLRYPPMSHIIMSCDTAYTSKQENDYSACVVFGVFRHRGNPKIMLMEAWQERLEFHDLVQKIIATAKKRKVDALLVEAKASGLSVKQEIQRLCGEEEFMIYPINPGAQDKVARMHSIVPLFSAGCIYAPDRQWADDLITNVAKFPKGAHDDLADAVSQGIGYLRKIGLAQLANEADSIQTASRTFQGSEADEELYPDV